MSLDFVQVDVFADAPFTGNPVAVFPDAADLETRQMQALASEMNLSETTFVTSVARDSYTVRIFTPSEEMPFAGHPTLGAAWVLRDLGRLHAESVVQESEGGRTPVEFDGDLVWLTRSGKAFSDLETIEPDAVRAIADALGLDGGDIGLEARELGRSGRLRPACSDAGLHQLMVPVRDEHALARCRAPVGLDIGGIGTYCFCAAGAGRVRARGLWPAVGVTEDPATGSAAAALGLYLAERVGDIDFEIAQGIEINRPSRLHVKARETEVRVGGRCERILRGRIEAHPR